MSNNNRVNNYCNLFNSKTNFTNMNVRLKLSHKLSLDMVLSTLRYLDSEGKIDFNDIEYNKKDLETMMLMMRDVIIKNNVK